MIRTARQRRGGADGARRSAPRLAGPQRLLRRERRGLPQRLADRAAPLRLDPARQLAARFDRPARHGLQPLLLRRGRWPGRPASSAGRCSDDSGYRGEEVFYQPGEARPFVARCIAKATPEVPATCIRDVHDRPGLSMLYRFDRFYLGDWQAMDDRACANWRRRSSVPRLSRGYSRSMSRIAMVKL